MILLFRECCIFIYDQVYSQEGKATERRIEYSHIVFVVVMARCEGLIGPDDFERQFSQHGRQKCFVACSALISLSVVK